MAVFALVPVLDAGNLIIQPLSPINGRDAVQLALPKRPETADPQTRDALGRYLQTAFERRDEITAATFRGFGIAPQVVRVEDVGLYYHVDIRL